MQLQADFKYYLSKLNLSKNSQKNKIKDVEL